MLVEGEITKIFTLTPSILKLCSCPMIHIFKELSKKLMHGFQETLHQNYFIFKRLLFIYVQEQ